MNFSLLSLIVLNSCCRRICSRLFFNSARSFISDSVTVHFKF